MMKAQDLCPAHVKWLYQHVGLKKFYEADSLEKCQQEVQKCIHENDYTGLRAIDALIERVQPIRVRCGTHIGTALRDAVDALESRIYEHKLTVDEAECLVVYLVQKGYGLAGVFSLNDALKDDVKYLPYREYNPTKMLLREGWFFEKTEKNAVRLHRKEALDAAADRLVDKVGCSAFSAKQVIVAAWKKGYDIPGIFTRSRQLTRACASHQVACKDLVEFARHQGVTLREFSRDIEDISRAEMLVLSERACFRKVTRADNATEALERIQAILAVDTLDLAKEVNAYLRSQGKNQLWAGYSTYPEDFEKAVEALQKDCEGSLDGATARKVVASAVAKNVKFEGLWEHSWALDKYVDHLPLTAIGDFREILAEHGWEALSTENEDVVRLSSQQTPDAVFKTACDRLVAEVGCPEDVAEKLVLAAGAHRDGIRGILPQSKNFTTWCKGHDTSNKSELCRAFGVEGYRFWQLPDAVKDLRLVHMRELCKDPKFRDLLPSTTFYAQLLHLRILLSSAELDNDARAQLVRVQDYLNEVTDRVFVAKNPNMEPLRQAVKVLQQRPYYQGKSIEAVEDCILDAVLQSTSIAGIKVSSEEMAACVETLPLCATQKGLGIKLEDIHNMTYDEPTRQREAHLALFRVAQKRLEAKIHCTPEESASIILFYVRYSHEIVDVYTITPEFRAACETWENEYPAPYKPIEFIFQVFEQRGWKIGYAPQTAATLTPYYMRHLLQSPNFEKLLRDCYALKDVDRVSLEDISDIIKQEKYQVQINNYLQSLPRARILVPSETFASSKNAFGKLCDMTQNQIPTVLAWSLLSQKVRDGKVIEGVYDSVAELQPWTDHVAYLSEDAEARLEDYGWGLEATDDDGVVRLCSNCLDRAQGDLSSLTPPNVEKVFEEAKDHMAALSRCSPEEAERRVLYYVMQAADVADVFTLTPELQAYCAPLWEAHGFIYPEQGLRQNGLRTIYIPDKAASLSETHVSYLQDDPDFRQILGPGTIHRLCARLLYAHCEDETQLLEKLDAYLAARPRTAMIVSDDGREAFFACVDKLKTQVKGEVPDSLLIKILSQSVRAECTIAEVYSDPAELAPYVMLRPIAEVSNYLQDLLVYGWGLQTPESNVFELYKAAKLPEKVDLWEKARGHLARGAHAGALCYGNRQVVAGVRQLVPGASAGVGALSELLLPVLLLAAGYLASEKVHDTGLRAWLDRLNDAAGLALEGALSEKTEAALRDALPELKALAAVSRPELAAGDEIVYNKEDDRRPNTRNDRA